ncbi:MULTISPECIES: hypothetical protein [Anaeromyxobacter]|uniref:hypothetical protein n=1 Tax=Anaeromyxobacter TaxID=161492 RepID=UPI001F58063E|nr:MULTISPECIES: hypothetical protein [unclassified Anaeromyxobacter]
MTCATRALVAAAIAGSALRAGAQDGPRRAQDAALEVRLSSGYEQAFGEIGYALPSLGDYGGPGAALELAVAWRPVAAFALGVFGTGGLYARGGEPPAGAEVWSIAGGAQAELHVAPDERWDPWIALGVALRRHGVEREGGTESFDGHEVLRLRLGFDRRFGARSTLGPVVAVALARFTRHERPDGSAVDVPSPSLGLIAFAGLSAAFDL